MKVGPIQSVEEVGAELQLRAFAGYAEFLVPRDIELEQWIASGCIAACIAEWLINIGDLHNVRIKIANDSALAVGHHGVAGYIGAIGRERTNRCQRRRVIP